MPTSLPGREPAGDHVGPADLAARGERLRGAAAPRPRAASGRRARRPARRRSRRVPAPRTSRAEAYATRIRRPGSIRVAPMPARRTLPASSLVLTRRRSSPPAARTATTPDERKASTHDPRDHDHHDRRAPRRRPPRRPRRGQHQAHRASPSSSARSRWRSAPATTTLYVVEKAGPGPGDPRRAARRPSRCSTSRRLVNSGGNEQGLLGLAFSPDGTKLYVHYSNQRTATPRVDEYAVAADGAVDTGVAARRSSRRTSRSRTTTAASSPSGRTAASTSGLGDGGGAGDQGDGHASGGNGQSLGTLLGKILRIDPTPSGGQAVHGPAGQPVRRARPARDPEIWAYGLRNPWRFSFDKTTGDLWIGDVGQNAWEEVDLAAKAAGGGKGVNFGWNVFEGTHSLPRRRRARRGPPGVRVLARRRQLLGHRRLRVPRHEDPGAARRLPVRRLLRRRAPRDRRVQDGKVAQERVLPVRAAVDHELRPGRATASSTCSPTRARCSGSTPPDRAARPLLLALARRRRPRSGG